VNGEKAYPIWWKKASLPSRWHQVARLMLAGMTDPANTIMP
jgi:uncharacterized protein YbdZ (MbtH family)